jgi:hypothetical protein
VRWTGIWLALVVGCLGCTEQDRAKSFGGTMTVELQPGRKLVNVTWKETDLWYLTRAMRNDEAPETYEFQESSGMGVMEGKVIIKERR